MKRLSFILLILCAQANYAQNCKTLAANKPSDLVRGADAYQSPNGKINTTEINKIKPHFAKAENWTKKILTNFTGAKLLYYNSFFPDYLNDGSTHKDFNAATGLKTYFDTRMMFFAYYCYDNSNTIQTEGESGAGVNVYFNNFFTFKFTSYVGVYTINGKPAFNIIQKKRSEGRIDFYEKREQNNTTAKMYTTHDFIILRNSDKTVFIPVTRKEYLQQMLIDAETFGLKDTKFMSDAYNQNAKQFEAEIKVYKEMDKTYTAEKEAKRRKWFEEDQEKLKSNMSKGMPNSGAAKVVLLQYLKKPADWLNRGFKNFYSNSTYTAESVKQLVENWDKSYPNGEEETLEEIVTVNPAYYNKTLGSDVPQLIMVHLRNNGYPYMEKVAALVKQPGALAPLEALLNGKSTPVEITPPYTFRFLPKLNTLSPLTIPADMKASTVPAIPFNNPPTATLNIETPSLSAKLKELPATIFTTAAYTNYISELNSKISIAIKPEIKKKADDYVKNKKLTQSKDISNIALAAWLQNTPKASLYLYSKAVASNPADALAANNFAAFLIMGGLPEKSIPILEYWNKQKPGETTILSNLGNAYYRLGNVTKAMTYLQQAVQKDSLNPAANKILCIMYLKKGNVKKAEEHGKKSIATSHDEEVISILRQLNNKVKPGELMSRFPPLPAKEFPMLQRIKLPAMPSSLDDMDEFETALNAFKKSLQMTIEDIEAKNPDVREDMVQKLMGESFKKGISPIRVKAQYIIMDGMQIYHNEKLNEYDVFKFLFKKMNAPYQIKTKVIQKKYADQLNKLEGGVAGDENKIAALEMARCKELNGEAEIYLAGLSRLVNQFASRQEYVSRKFFRDYANWAPYWMPETIISFPSIESDYLKDILEILREYQVIKKINCSVFEPLPIKAGELQKWEEEYCANFKGKIGIGPAKVFWTCNSYGMEAGEGIVGGFEVNYTEDGAFEDVTLELGLGANWNMGTENIAQIGAGASVKEFVKIGPDNTTGKWEVKDAGVKGEISIEGEIGNVSGEVKVIEVSAGYSSGVTMGGVLVPILQLN